MAKELCMYKEGHIMMQFACVHMQYTHGMWEKTKAVLLHWIYSTAVYVYIQTGVSGDNATLHTRVNKGRHTC